MPRTASRLGTRTLIAAVLLLGATLVIALLITLTGEHPRPRQRTPAQPGALTAANAAERSRRLTIGYSVRGRRIVAVERARPGVVRTVLVVGCVHGNEPAGIAIASRLLRAAVPPGVALWIVPVLNPDGVAADTRQNADAVDLNRNFPWHWRPLGVPGDLQYSGSGPLSEPESLAAYRLILRIRPQLTIWFHQPQTLVDLSGGNADVERRFARLVGLPAYRLTRYPGSVVNWENALLPNATAFVVELPPGPLTTAAIARYAHAVLTIAGQA